jgi:hypothetical protein
MRRAKGAVRLSRAAAGRLGRAAGGALFMKGSRSFQHAPSERVGLVVEVARGADVISRAGVLAGNGHGGTAAEVLSYALLVGLASLERQDAPPPAPEGVAPCFPVRRPGIVGENDGT